MGPLTQIEEFILLTVHQLGDNAYGVSIRKHIAKTMKKKVSVGAIYVPLERLEKKGLLISYTGEPTAERGGRSKRFYKLSSEGLSALEETKRLRELFWAGNSVLG